MMIKKEVKARIEKKLDRIRTFGGVAFLLIPGGLLAWLFWPSGWKVSVAGLIVYLTVLIFVYAAKEKIKDLEQQEENNNV